MRCICLYVDRGKAILKKGKYEVTVGEFKKGLFSKPTPFYIPEKFKNVILETHGIINSNVLPFFVIDAKSSMVLNYVQNPDDAYYPNKDGKMIKMSFGINLTAEHDPTIAVKLKVLIKTSFWEMLAKRLKMGLLVTLIYLGAGYGLLRFIEYLVTIMFLHHT